MEETSLRFRFYYLPLYQYNKMVKYCIDFNKNQARI